ncbi:MAG: hypothetical protein ACREBO_02225 [Novosphingobium sp.]
MAHQRLFRISGVDLPRRAAALGVAAVLAGVAVLAAAGQRAETPAAAGSGLLSRLGPGPLGKLRALQLSPEGRPPRGIERYGRAALTSAPLAYEPFFAVAAAGFRGKDATGSKTDAALLEEALRRNPRSREARLLLMRHAVGAGDLKRAIDQLAVLDRLNSQMVAQLMLALGKAIRSERQVDEAVAALGPHPELYRPFMTGFAGAQKPASLVVRLVPQLPPAALADSEIRRLAVAEMVRAEAFAEARRLWDAGSGKRALVHSPDFADAKAPPPFNWELATDSTGAAERQAGGGISVDYYGRDPGPLVAQLLTLAPGSYTAALRYRTDSGAPGALGLQVRCAASDAPLAVRALDASAGADAVATIVFTVPAQGCRGQSLSVVGRVQEARDPQAALLTRLDVTRGTGR